MLLKSSELVSTTRKKNKSVHRLDFLTWSCGQVSIQRGGDKLESVKVCRVVVGNPPGQSPRHTPGLLKGFCLAGICSSQSLEHCWTLLVSKFRESECGRPRDFKSLISSAIVACFQSLAIFIKHIILDPGSSYTGQELSTFYKASEGWGWPAACLQMEV